MSNFVIGAKYRYVKHPDKPIGTADSYDIFTGNVRVVWENTKLIPPMQNFPESCFSDGTFEALDESIITLIGGDPRCWNHIWIKYTGLREIYEYCKNCDMKRFTK